MIRSPVAAVAERLERKKNVRQKSLAGQMKPKASGSRFLGLGSGTTVEAPALRLKGIRQSSTAKAERKVYRDGKS